MLRKTSLILLAYLGIVSALACPSHASKDAGPDAAITGQLDAGAAAPLWIHIFHSSDEHGWLQPYQDSTSIWGGVANFYAGWRDSFNCDFSQDLFLSSGDNWAGPAISSWFDGEPTVELMNAMGYQASAAGNHEFDDGLELFAERAAQANYPYLSANIFWRDSGERPDFLQPWVMLSSRGVQIGVMGLTTVSTAMRPIRLMSQTWSLQIRSRL